MKTITKNVLMLCFFILSGALCYANGKARTENEKGKEGTPIEVIERASHGGSEKGTTIQASIDGHWLSVTFTQNIGTLTMELEKVSGAVIFNYPTVPTPDSYQFYLNQTGDYIITFTLSNGDEYYGEFTVTD